MIKIWPENNLVIWNLFQVFQPSIRSRAKQSLSLMKDNVINSDGAETVNDSKSVTTEKPNGN